MKLISAILFLGPVFADFQQMENIWMNLEHEGWSFHQIFNSDYGCWCHFDNNMAMGFGDPLDPLDESCRKLQRGYDCLKYDYPEELASLDPHEVQYVFHPKENPTGDLMVDARQGCIESNPGKSQLLIDACTIENSFVTELHDYLTTYGLVSAFYHETGNTLPACTFSANSHNDKFWYGSAGMTQFCSGDFPHRMPSYTVTPGLNLINSEKLLLHKDQCVSYSNGTSLLTLEPCATAMPWYYSGPNSIKSIYDECIRVKKKKAFTKFKLSSYDVGLAPCKTGNLLQSFIWCPETGHLKVFADQRYCLKTDDEDNFFVGPCGNVSIENFEEYAVFGK